MSKSVREVIIREDLKWWSRETGYTEQILKSAIKRGELKAERPGRSPRSRLYVSSVAIGNWLAEIAEESA